MPADVLYEPKRSWCSGPVGIGRDGARHFGTGRHCGDDDGAGRIPGGGRFNSVAEFVSGRLLLDFLQR